MVGRYKVNKYYNIQNGWEVIGEQKIYCRSSYERDCAYYFEYLRRTGQITKWTHEAFKINFPIKNAKNYVPDFVLYNIIDGAEKMVKIVEVKGKIEQSDITKIKRLKRYFPEYFSIFCYVGKSEYLDMLRAEHGIPETIDIKQIKEFSRFFKNQIKEEKN